MRVLLSILFMVLITQSTLALTPGITPDQTAITQAQWGGGGGGWCLRLREQCNLGQTWACRRWYRNCRFR